MKAVVMDGEKRFPSACAAARWVANDTGYKPTSREVETMAKNISACADGRKHYKSAYEHTWTREEHGKRLETMGADEWKPQNYRSVAKIPIELDVWSDLKCWCFENGVTLQKKVAELVTDFVMETREEQSDEG